MDYGQCKCFMLLSTIFQLYNGCQFYWRRNFGRGGVGEMVVDGVGNKTTVVRGCIVYTLPQEQSN